MKQYGADNKVLLKETTEFLIRVVFFSLGCLFVCVDAIHSSQHFQLCWDVAMVEPVLSR